MRPHGSVVGLTLTSVVLLNFLPRRWDFEGLCCSSMFSADEVDRGSKREVDKRGRDERAALRPTRFECCWLDEGFMALVRGFPVKLTRWPMGLLLG